MDEINLGDLLEWSFKKNVPLAKDGQVQMIKVSHRVFLNSEKKNQNNLGTYIFTKKKKKKDKQINKLNKIKELVA